MRLVALVEYDGTEFAGFQVQAHPGGSAAAPPRTVQAALERAIWRTTGQEARVVGAGRTDAGVHAAGQVVHFDSEAPLVRDLAQMARAMNAHLPADVAVRTLRPAPAGFHARYSALSRRYSYRIYQAATASPLNRRFTHHVRVDLAVEPMAVAAAFLVGSHDFRAFGAQEGPGSTRRDVYRAAVAEAAVQPWALLFPVWHTDSSPEAGAPPAPSGAEMDGEVGEPARGAAGTAARVIEIEIEANAFLRHMMRRIAGTLIRIGAGRLAPEAVADALRSGDKAAAGPAAPARGLCLQRVRYPTALGTTDT